MKSINSVLLLLAGISLFLLNGCGEKYTIDEQESFTLIRRNVPYDWAHVRYSNGGTALL